MPRPETDNRIKKLCYRCVGESYLKAQIKSNGKRAKCWYCESMAKAYSVDELADIVESAFDRHYELTSDEPNSWQSSLMADKESDYSWYREGEMTVDAIMSAGDFPEDAALDIQEMLEERYFDFDAAAIGLETPFSSDAHYKEKKVSDSSWQEDWRKFENILKTETRFFNLKAIPHLTEIFSNLELLQSHQRPPIILKAGPGTDLHTVFRARVFQSDEKIRTALAFPDKNFGPPPSIFASSGRMNAKGISVFYGANESDVALAEVRPPVGSQVVVAQFEIIRQIKLLDLTALKDVSVSGSIFDPEYARLLEKAMFLRNLSQRITMPVMPDDQDAEYLATQAIADFLASGNNPEIDGIIFPSVQVEGKASNIVLFHKSSRVETMHLPVGTEVSVRLGDMYEEGWEIQYSITEEVPVRTGNEKTYDMPDPDWRIPTLRIESDSIDVYIIKAIAFRSEKYKVNRLRLEKNDEQSTLDEQTLFGKR